MNFSSQLRHFLTYLAGLGTALATWHLIAPDQVEAVNKAGADLISPLTVILGAVGVFVFRLAITWLGKIFSGLAGKASGGMSGGTMLLMVCGTMAGIGGCLPSCSAQQLAAARAVPVKACVITPEGNICYSSKAGIEVAIPSSRKVKIKMAGPVNLEAVEKASTPEPLKPWTIAEAAEAMDHCLCVIATLRTPGEFSEYLDALNKRVETGIASLRAQAAAERDHDDVPEQAAGNMQRAHQLTAAGDDIIMNRKAPRLTVEEARQAREHADCAYAHRCSAIEHLTAK